MRTGIPSLNTGNPWLTQHQFAQLQLLVKLLVTMAKLVQAAAARRDGNRKVENTVNKIIHDNVVHVDSGDIANMFNDYFVDIERNIAESIGGNNANHLDYMTHLNQPTLFFFRPIHCCSTEKLICSLKNKSYLNTVPVKI